MHAGVAAFVRWVESRRNHPEAKVGAPASSADISGLIERLGTTLPQDLRVVMQRFNGARLPAGTLLATHDQGDAMSMESELKRFVAAQGESRAAANVPLPFFKSSEGSVLCFDRGAAPVADTWPVIDFYEETGETRLVHRTFDGWCETVCLQWASADFEGDFTVASYLRQGKRHLEVEPDVSTSHATVAHAYRRAGEPEKALMCYLHAGACIPPLLWCDWEALKMSILLRKTEAAWEAAFRLTSPAPPHRWRERETDPARVADAIARAASLDTGTGLSIPPLRGSHGNGAPDLRHPWGELMDRLHQSVEDPDERAHVIRVHDRMLRGEPPGDIVEPEPVPFVVPEDLDAAWSETKSQYHAGHLRDEHMLFSPELEPLRSGRDLSELLRIRREF